jgi:predicted RNA-binding protein with PUA-like domain
MAQAGQYWLMKSEPEAYSIHDLAAEPTRTTHWDGVRNYQARNFMRSMGVGDRVLFYHSNVEPPAVAGAAVVARMAYPDFTALDPADKHYDPKATQESPIWEMVDIRLDRVFSQPIPLDALRANPGLKGMELLRRGSRLSVQPVSREHFEIVLKLADQAPAEPAAPAASLKRRAASAGRATHKAAKSRKVPQKQATRESQRRARGSRA